VLQWRYEPTIRYGGPKLDMEALSVSDAEASDDRRQVRLRLPGLRTDRVVHLQLVDFVDDSGAPPFTTECSYTLNALP
jgi:hypothetical protein